MLTEEGLKGWIREGIHPPNYSQFATDYLPKHGVAVAIPPGYIEAANDYINPAFEGLANGEQAADIMPDAVRGANEVLTAAWKTCSVRHSSVLWRRATSANDSDGRESGRVNRLSRPAFCLQR